MEEEADKLTKRIAAMEAEIEQLKSRPVVATNFGMALRGVRNRSSLTFFGIPWYDVALGPSVEKGETHGHAKGIFAIGDIATGVFALGGMARGLVAFGGMAIGLVTAFGGLAIGSLALGGGAVGGVALGGGAAGYVAIGGGAAGFYAMGGGAYGKHVIDATRRDKEAIEFFSQWIPDFEHLINLPKNN